DDAGDLVRLQRLNAVARKHHAITSMQGERLSREIHQVQLLSGHCGAQQMPPRVGTGFHCAQPALRGKLVERRGERMILVEEGDLPVAVEMERAVADAHPLDAVSAEERADESRAHAPQLWMGGDML